MTEPKTPSRDLHYCGERVSNLARETVETLLGQAWDELDHLRAENSRLRNQLLTGYGAGK